MPDIGTTNPILPISFGIMVVFYLISLIISIIADYLYDFYLVKYADDSQRTLIRSRIKSDFERIKNLFRSNKIEKFDKENAKSRLTIVEKVLNERINSKENRPFLDIIKEKNSRKDAERVRSAKNTLSEKNKDKKSTDNKDASFNQKKVPENIVMNQRVEIKNEKENKSATKPDTQKSEHVKQVDSPRKNDESQKNKSVKIAEEKNQYNSETHKSEPAKTVIKENEAKKPEVKVAVSKGIQTDDLPVEKKPDEPKPSVKDEKNVIKPIQNEVKAKDVKKPAPIIVKSLDETHNDSSDGDNRSKTGKKTPSPDLVVSKSVEAHVSSDKQVKASSVVKPASGKPEKKEEASKEAAKIKQLSVEEAIKKLQMSSRSASVFIEIRESDRPSTARSNNDGNKAFSIPYSDDSKTKTQPGFSSEDDYVSRNRINTEKKQPSGPERPKSNYPKPNPNLLEMLSEKNPLNQNLSKGYREKQTKMIQENLKVDSASNYENYKRSKSRNSSPTRKAKGKPNKFFDDEDDDSTQKESTIVD